jgi:hypothetical protein
VNSVVVTAALEVTLLTTLLLAAACSKEADQTECDCRGTAGSSGTAGFGGGGAGGSSGGPMMGAGGVGGGVPVMGAAGAGSGGSCGACRSDEGCEADQGAGSLCVATACTKATGACEANAFVVVEQADEALASAESRDACFFRALASALAAVGAGTERVAAYAATSARVPGPLTVPANVTLEGHTADVSTPVALEVMAPIAGSPLVTMAAGSALKGFALDGKGTARGIAASSGAVRLEGPLRLSATALAVELTGDAVATLRGGVGLPPVVLTGNARGIDVGQDAGLDLQGDGEAGGVLVETTGMAAGILIRAGEATFENKVAGLLAKDNVGTGPNGTGAVEIRKGRKVTISGSVFRKNSRGISLNGENNSAFEAFSNVLISGSVFENPSPTTGTAICGSLFGGATQLTLGNGNAFPSGRQTPDNCTELSVEQRGSCETGGDLGVSDPLKPFDLTSSCGI